MRFDLTCSCWNWGCKMDFPGLWFCSKRANYLIWLGPEQTHTLSKTLLFKLTLNYLNQPAEAQPHFHQAMLRKTVPHAAHCFCWQWTGSWHFKYNFTNSYYRAEQLLYNHKMNLKQPSFKMKDSVLKYFLDIQGQNAITMAMLKLENAVNCF